MFKIMSNSQFLLVILLFICPIALQQSLPPKAVDPKRIKQLSQTLSWMTFRKNGQLATEQDLEPLFEALKERHANSKYYKTMLIAFSRGVIPKLTLKENSPCNPAYTKEYRDSHNKSVTDIQLEKFIILSYDKRGDISRQYCDYRKGLICNQQTKKCECPEGSKMELVSQGSSGKRCLLQENEICSLLDLDHDPSSNYGALKKLLPDMIFNLEKPLGCQMGTQCRFKSTNPTTPLCYGVNNAPSWDKGRWDIDLGEECTLGLYGETGQCKEKGNRTSLFPGYTCFNFGPRSKPRSPSVGFCAHDLGSYAISIFAIGDLHNDLNWELQMIGFVSPATTPLRGQRLLDYYNKYNEKLFTELSINFLQSSSMARYPGDRCNIAKTEKLLELWKFFKNLEDPPHGKGYLTTEAELDDKFKEAETLTVDMKKKICQVYSKVSKSKIDHALRCVPDSTDAAGNNGRCEVIPEKEDASLSWAKSFFQYRKYVTRTIYEMFREERNYRADIYEPDLECDPKLGPPMGSQGAAPSTDSFVLEGGFCPPDRACYVDYGDYQQIYNRNDCTLKNPKPKMYLECQSLDDNRFYDHCERKYLDKLFDEELSTVSSSSGLQRGDACQHDLEMKLRNWIDLGSFNVKGSKYKRLIDLQNIKNGIGGFKLCDRTKLLECSQGGTCECYRDTTPREVALEAGVKYYSDYCYVTSGDCDTRYSEPLRYIFEKSSEVEKNEIQRHYGAREGEGGEDCQNSNWCAFTIVQYSRLKCTAINTGSTGFEGQEPWTTTSTTTVRTTTTMDRTTTDGEDESKLVCQEEHCGWQDAGEARKEIHIILKMIMLIKMLIKIV